MEFVEGLRVGDREALVAAGLSPAEVAANGARIFMKMAFEFGFFHGDPHPGNIRVLRDGVIGLIDYGMVGRLEEEKREQLINLLQAITQGNVRGCVDQVLMIGRPFRPVDRPLFQSDVRDFIESYYGVPLEKINVGNLLSDFVNPLSHGLAFLLDNKARLAVYAAVRTAGLIGNLMIVVHTLPEETFPMICVVIE